MNKKQKVVLYRIIVSFVLLIGCGFIPVEGFFQFVIYLIPYLLIGYDILDKAIYGIKNKQIFDENFLMAIATVGALALQNYKEAVAVMLFYQIGELFQSYAVGKSRQNIAALMDIRPDYANIEQDGKLIKVDPSEVEIGTIITVTSGEKIPIDGIVIFGSASLNNSSLTGESAPVEVGENDEVFSGGINVDGLLKIKTTKLFEDSTVSKILDLVENASSLKSKSEDFISKFARYYTPIVCYCALFLAFGMPLGNLLLGNASQFSVWLYRALTFLVISCPCALVISIPLSFFAGIGGASSQGILIKGSNYLETLSKVNCLVFDKTGTVTKGVFEVDSIHHSPLEDKQLLRYAAFGEHYSNHPIARSIKTAYGAEIDEELISEYKELAGKGVSCKVENDSLLVGNDKLMEMFDVVYLPCHQIGTVVHVALNGEYLGHILIKDQIKKDSKQAIEQLHKIGVNKLVMLTGDRENVAREVAEQLGIDEVYSQLLPNEKVEILEQLLASKRNDEMVGFVGDGINDAPVLTRADVGISMGALGSDAAIEASDVVLMDDNLLKIVKAIKISKKCLSIVKQNIAFAIGIKVLCLILTVFGFTSMWLGIFADVGVMIIAVLNAIRALYVKKL
ncbi:MAG: heavy metal translocating P-type ATPase [Erysipelotrichaceae bacterium]